MYCPKCGTQNDDNAYKCIKCGIIIQQLPSATLPVKKDNTLTVVLVIAAIVFASFMVMGILAAIAVPAYLDYSTKAKISEVTAAFDDLAQAAAEYHADTGQFPEQSYPLDELVTLPQTYGTFSCPERISNNAITYRFTFNNTISQIEGRTLDMEITYAPDTGYTKQWLSTSTVPPKFIPPQ